MRNDFNKFQQEPGVNSTEIMTNLYMVRPGKRLFPAICLTVKIEVIGQNRHLAYKYIDVSSKFIYTEVEALSDVVNKLESKLRRLGLSSAVSGFVKY